MVVCKYFMEGYCKYGTRCKFEHVNVVNPYTRRYDSQGTADYSSGDRPIGVSIMKGGNTTFANKEFEHSFAQNTQPTSYYQNTYQQNSYQQNNYQQSSFQQASQVTPFGSKHNIQEIMQIILKDILQSEKGSQWQLSSYSPSRDLTNIPGLEDHSPEELRWECYKALQNGTLPLCQALVQQLYAHVAKINNELKKKDSAYTIVERWLREGQESFTASHTNTATSLGPTGFTDAPQFYSPAESQVRNSSFSFALPQQQPVSAQTYPSATSVFGGNPTHQPFSSAPELTPLDSSAYSSVEELTEGELEAFKADVFVFGAIPTKPPPKELCKV
uniref:Nucleoporin NUP42 n=2 Tax=Graphocephala atropunctata TaxID=36148 RepID=A0A1B6L632_9HEMI